MPVYTLASVILLKVNKLTNQVHILTLGLYSLARSHYFVCIFRIKFEKIIITIGDTSVKKNKHPHINKNKINKLLNLCGFL